MIKLKPYQEDAIAAVSDTFQTFSRQYIEMPTGSGKTITFLSYAHKNSKSVLIIVPSIHLMHQIYETAVLFYDISEISRKGDRHNENIRKCHICIIHSLKSDYLKTLLQHKFDLMVIDEAHHAQSNLYRKLIDSSEEIYGKDVLKILGVTATPDRLDGKFIEEVLCKCSYRIDIEKLIELKHLSDIEGYTSKTSIDISDIDSHNGDFSIPQLFNKLNSNLRNNIILNSYKDKLIGRKTLIFCINIKHSKQICKMMNDHNISCAHIDGLMNPTERDSILNAFRIGQFSVLCNCQLLTEGFDEPSIDGIILARPTKSKALFIQMIGRGLRTFPNKKNCIVVDIADSHNSISQFSCLIDKEVDFRIDEFQSIKNIRAKHEEEHLKDIKTEIERANLLSFSKVDRIPPTRSMIEYLETNKIMFIEPISFNECSFLIWFNKLKHEYNNGTHKKIR